MPWRENTDFYWVLVSEVMLQQTQVNRVLQKFPEFITAFPTIEALARASIEEVLRVWQGLGYNRRALNIKKAAELIAREGMAQDLTVLPGIGANTAGSITAFACNKPVVFIETNIRRVFIHHFFADAEGIHDQELIPLVEATLDSNNVREWYWALMDYGTELAKTVPNPNRRSKHYTKQSKFEGSDRQVRGEIVRQLLQAPRSLAELIALDARVERILPVLIKEGFVTKRGQRYTLA
jgi:A/G-specific adenine glycosylase